MLSDDDQTQTQDPSTQDISTQDSPSADAEGGSAQPAADASAQTAADSAPQASGYVGQFSFQMQSGEAIGDRIVRCCQQALADGQMGENDRHDFYRDFIACNQEASQNKAEALTHVRTSCAMFVRAVRQWCGAAAVGPYLPGTGIFVSIGNVSFGHPAFVPYKDSAKPNVGDSFYISSTDTTKNDGHTGIFIAEGPDGIWKTAEGGGGDGTLCRFTQRTLDTGKFKEDARHLWGWFDCTKVGLPPSPDGA
ncbi:MAG TPA: hypothetical protein VKZ53_14020 [Candidatus Angelobacter sp.]|nr:hypothetical protein [Candidatus Angelobacter sp.]